MGVQEDSTYLIGQQPQSQPLSKPLSILNGGSALYLVGGWISHAAADSYGVGRIEELHSKPVSLGADMNAQNSTGARLHLAHGIAT
jgi:hypothetical protein